MILLIGEIPVRSGMTDKFLQVAGRVAAASRREEGCLSYRYFKSAEGKEAVIFLEQWEDMAAIERHEKAPHFQRFQEEAAPLMAGEPQIDIYQAERIQR
ncbi:MAG: antibiotic biosynthesis monooxygenase [Spirochaetales bacterium]|nr:antibiotic biosynthesis monooxygenase [Spirochaetales bacterium]MCF7938515.1 antibiotic biosynthesis monooxygenase [Spirochaetales bacterium]